MRNVGKCTAFRSCRRRAKYDAPAKLCSKHWLMWWSYGVKGRPLPFAQRLDIGGQLVAASVIASVDREMKAGR